MKRIVPAFVFIGSLLFNVMQARASGIEWDNTTFDNPIIDAFEVKKFKGVVYGNAYNVHEEFTGKVTYIDPFLGPVTQTGTASSNQLSTWFDGSVYYRFNPCFVGSVRVSKPYGADTQYGNHSVIASQGTVTYLDTWNIAPSLTYIVNPKLAVLAGVDLLEARRAELSNILFPASLNQEFSSKFGNAWSAGYHLGVAWRVFTPTVLSVIYFSPKTITLQGKSTLGATTVISNQVDATLDFPSHTKAQIFQYLSEALYINLTAEIVRWHRMQNVILINGAGPGTNIVLPLNYKNTITWTLGTAYDVTSKLSIYAAATYDPTSVKNTSGGGGSPNLPNSADNYWGTLGGFYRFTDHFKTELGYTQVFPSKSKSQGISAATGDSISGTTKTSTDCAWFSLTYEA